MRNSLWTRLMGVFLGVIIVGVIVMVVSVQLTTAAQLKRRVLSDDVAQANALAPLLAGLYSQNGNWNGVESFLAAAPSQAMPTNPEPDGMIGPMMGPQMMWSWPQWVQVTRVSGSTTDRVVVMDRSHIIARGRPAELVATYVGEQVLEVRLGFDERERTLALLRELVPGREMDEVEDTVYVYAQDGQAIDQAVVSLLERRADQVTLRRATLEDVFLRLTGRGLIE